MSRLCRLRTYKHGQDGQWAYEEIIKLREQVAEQAAVIESLKSALKDCYVEFFYVNQQLNGVLDEDGEPLYMEGKSVTAALAKGKEALAIPTDSTQILAEVRRAERERVIAIAEAQGWAMRNEDPFEDAVREICAIRAME